MSTPPGCRREAFHRVMVRPQQLCKRRQPGLGHDHGPRVAAADAVNVAQDLVSVGVEAEHSGGVWELDGNGVVGQVRVHLSYAHCQALGGPWPPTTERWDAVDQSPADRSAGSSSYGPCHEEHRQPGGIRARGTPLAWRPRFGDRIDPESVGAQHVDVRRRRTMVGAHPPAETGQRTIGRPPAFIVITAGRRPGSGDVLPPSKHGCSREDEPARWREHSGDCR
jgi:hypothetical protein